MNEIFFVEDLLSKSNIYSCNNTETKKNAVLLILPVFYGLSSVNACGDHEENKKDIEMFLNKELLLNDTNNPKNFLIVAVIIFINYSNLLS